MMIISGETILDIEDSLKVHAYVYALLFPVGYAIKYYAAVKAEAMIGVMKCGDELQFIRNP